MTDHTTFDVVFAIAAARYLFAMLLDTSVGVR